MSKTLLVDGNSIANRAFYALPFLSNSEGKPSGAVFGFANILIKILLEEKPDNIVVAFDHARKTFRNEIYSQYKMQRKQTPPELISQFKDIKEMLKSLDIIFVEKEGIEADDIIGTLSKTFSGDIIILSGDRDLFQLIDDNTTVWLTKKGVSEVDKVDEKRLAELYSLSPWQVVEIKGLMGDQSDNIPGVKGIGEKTAFSLLEEFRSIDNLYAHIDTVPNKYKNKLLQGRDDAYMSKTLATIKRDCDIEINQDECKLKFPFDSKAYAFFKEWNFTSILKNKDYFNFDIKHTENKSKRVLMNNDIIKKIKDSDLKEFCYNLNTLEFAYKNDIYYLEKNYTLFDETVSIEDVLHQFKDIFENQNILKITYSSKSDMHCLKKYGISLNNYFDISLAEYLVMAGNKNNASAPSVNEYPHEKKRLEAAIKEKGLDYVYNNIEFPLTSVLFEMEENGFKINEEKLDEIAHEFEEKLNQLKEEIFLLANEEFNINSPKQVANILFEKLGIQTYNNKKLSTRAGVLDELKYIPIVDKILTYRKYSKLINTYVRVYKQICEDSGDIIHTTFNQTLTSTGRLSSSEPNLQNIPTRDDEGRILRKIFVSKFDNGSIISADYNQIELRLMADMSGEPKLIEAYNNGEDIHSLTASHIFKIPIEKVTASERRDAKAVNFGIIYGISDYGLSQSIKSSKKTAKDFIESYFKEYPKVKEFMDNNVEKAKENGYAITKYGRIRQIPEISSSKYIARGFGERVAMNMPLQGTASDIIKIAMLKVANALKEGRCRSQLILQIHDELIIDVFPGEEKKVAKILKENMENVASLKVPLVATIGLGKSLFDCK